MLRKMVGAMVGQQVMRHVSRRHGDMAGMALGYALASRRLRVPALAGVAAMAVWELWQAKRDRDAETGRSGTGPALPGKPAL